MSLGGLVYTNELIYNYMVESFALIDGVDAGIPDLIDKPKLKPRSFSSRVKLYRELETVMIQNGISEYLNIRSLPDLEFSEPEKG